MPVDYSPIAWEPWRWTQSRRLSVPGARAFAEGDATAKRWRSLLGGLDLPAVNLLPPHPDVGAWDAGLAHEQAGYLMDWAYEREVPLVLVGRRVERAVFLGAGYTPGEYSRHRLRFGQSIELGCVDILLLPHPSGRGRVLNDPATRDRMRGALRRFCAVEPAL